MLYHLDNIYQLLQYYHPNVKATTLLDNQKAISCSLSAAAWSSYKAIWALHLEPDQCPLQDKETHDPWK